MNPAMWQELARTIHDEILKGAQGIIVTHGTDTMLYSAAAVSFMLSTPVPIVFVGAQRSADRPSSDNATNAICSAQAAVSDLGEVVVCMHATESDTTCALHRATRVRKNHTSRRDAFQSIGREPVGGIGYPEGTVGLAKDAVLRGTEELRLSDNLASNCGLLQYYPGMNPAVIDAFKGYKGLVIAGTGLGHVGTDCIESIKGLTTAGTTVVMTSQCQAGNVCDRVYETGRDLLDAGVIEGGSMLPEVALVKPVSYTHLRAHETSLHLVCRLLLEKKKKKKKLLRWNPSLLPFCGSRKNTKNKSRTNTGNKQITKEKKQQTRDSRNNNSQDKLVNKGTQ
eukprot:TRINITY_DN14109_c0_g1_i2.p1 TRINITY_DN14109_c0_g1~~TRINITY_DN14109_c0_g1_i2.p1  ORF type:complete len:338 (-),score=54.81 TRINITY_DN14109_c0_g1_i2:20-1033(-)